MWKTRAPYPDTGLEEMPKLLLVSSTAKEYQDLVVGMIVKHSRRGRGKYKDNTIRCKLEKQPM